MKPGAFWLPEIRCCSGEVGQDAGREPSSLRAVSPRIQGRPHMSMIVMDNPRPCGASPPCGLTGSRPKIVQFNGRGFAGPTGPALRLWPISLCTVQSV
jgi:hypothetical protein